MNRFDLTDAEDVRLRFSVILPGRRHSLYEYLCELPLEYLQDTDLGIRQTAVQ